MSEEADVLISEQEKKVRESMILGQQAKEFLNSDLARFINNTAEAIVVSAMDELTKVKPTDTQKIMELQNIVARFEHYEKYLEELIVSADMAYQFYLDNFNAED